MEPNHQDQVHMYSMESHYFSMLYGTKVQPMRSRVHHMSNMMKRDMARMLSLYLMPTKHQVQKMLLTCDVLNCQVPK